MQGNANLCVPAGAVAMIDDELSESPTTCPYWGLLIHEDGAASLYDIPCREGYSQDLHSALKEFRDWFNDEKNRRTGVETVAIGNPVVAEPHQPAPTTDGQRSIRPRNLVKHVSDCSLWISPFNRRYLFTAVTPCWHSIQFYLMREGVLQPQSQNKNR